MTRRERLADLNDRWRRRRERRRPSPGDRPPAGPEREALAESRGTPPLMLLGNVVLYIPGLIWLAKFYAGPGAQYVANTGATTAAGA